MSDQTTKSADTSRSWRAMRKVFCLIACVGGAVGASGAWFSDLPENWHETDKIIEGIGLGLLGGIGGLIGAWLLIVALAFVWWFLLDRIREFVRAARGQP